MSVRTATAINSGTFKVGINSTNANQLSQQRYLAKARERSAMYPELRYKGLQFEQLAEASRVFPKPQLLSSKAKVTACEAQFWTGPEMHNAQTSYNSSVQGMIGSR